MIRLCIASQTPPVLPLPEATPAPGQVWRLGVDYVPQVGGVVPMMRALVRNASGRWLAPNPSWVALGNARLPMEFRTDEGYSVETLRLGPTPLERYVEFKEAVWRSFHGPWGLGPFATETYSAYVDFNHRMAQHLLNHLDSHDIFYVNDFQLLLVGGLIGSAAPAILRWHIPLELRGYPDPVRRFFLRSMEGFDAIVVSTRWALEELIRHGFHGRAFQVYPYLDPAEHGPATSGEVNRFREQHHLGDHPYVLSVGRMDPVKRQDLLLRAFALNRRRFPDHRLVIVGGESFSTSLAASSGAKTKDSEWRRRIREALGRYAIEDAVILTGRLSSADLRAAYGGASVFVHSAPWEGFGLVAVEAWLHGLPIVVSRGAGVSELVTDGLNGFVVPPGSVPALASRIGRLLASPALAERMGSAGRMSARRCHVQVASRRLREVFGHVLHTYRGRGRPQPAMLRA